MGIDRSASGSEGTEATRRDYRREPLRYLDRRLQAAPEVFWLPTGTLCVAEPAAAKAVLENRDGLFEEHSDFFHTSRGPFGPREVQVALGRGARRLLTEHVAAVHPDLPGVIDRRLAGVSEWPDAGNYLIYEHLGAVLVTPERTERMGPTVDRVVERSVLAGARERRSRLSRALFRWRVFRRLEREVRNRIESGAGSAEAVPRDLFDVLAQAAGPGVRTSDLGELYLPFLFAVVSSVGFTLGWSLYLLGTNPPVQAKPSWIVREALRLWPVAWYLLRRPARRHRIAGVEVGPDREVLVSPYVTQRHPRCWHEADRFRPRRWAESEENDAFIPFGWGPHMCAAAALTIEVVRQVLEIVLEQHRPVVSPLSDRPFIGPSLAPPRFRLRLAPS